MDVLFSDTSYFTNHNLPFVMEEENLVFSPEQKSKIESRLQNKEAFPDFGNNISHVEYMDGCKIYFSNGDFVLGRFSGTEPLLRIFAESSESNSAKQYIQMLRDFLMI